MEGIFLRYELIGDNYTFMPIEIILKNRGIDLNLFNLDELVLEDHYNYDNIKEAVELLMKHIKNESKIVIVADSDVDGATSFAALYLYLKSQYNDINIDIKIHTGKQHGLSKDIKINNDVNLVILPDASSNDFNQHKELKDRNIDVLVLDHHLCDEGYSNHALVVNNQLSNKVENKNLSGVGVVYKFLKALDDYLFIDEADYYLDLVALGNIADVMDLHEKETRFLVYKGLKNINNLFIQALIEDNSYELEDKYNITKVGWTIAPKLNGTIRNGTFKEKENMYKAFISNDYDFCLETAKKCRNVKARQDRAVKIGMQKIDELIKIKENDRCIVLDSGNILNKNCTGLVANKLVGIYNLPILLYSVDASGYASGSARCPQNISEQFREDLINSSLFEMCEGHENAFGFKFNIKNLDFIKEYLNNIYSHKEIIDNKVYKVDFVIEEDEIEKYFIDAIAELEDEFGNGIEESLIMYKNIKLNLSEENLKGRLNIVFYKNDIKFIKKFATNKLKNELINKDILVDIVGKCTMDTYNNCGQVEIVDIDIKAGEI